MALELENFLLMFLLGKLVRRGAEGADGVEKNFYD